jgi:WD40 repeat protein
MLALRMTASALMKRPDAQPPNGEPQALPPENSGTNRLWVNGAALFDLVEHPFMKELFVAWAPDGQGLVTYAQREDRSYLRRLDGVEQASFEGRFVAFTPDGQWVLTTPQRDGFDGNNAELQPGGAYSWADMDARFRLWSLDGVEQASFYGKFQGFTPDGQGLLFFMDGDNTLRLWGLDGVERANFEGAFKQFTPDGRGILTVSSRDNRPRLWSLDGVEQASFEGDFKQFTPDGQGLATDSPTLSISRLGQWWSPSGIRSSHLWSLDGTKQAVVRGYFHAFTPDGQRLVTTYSDGEDYTWGDYIASQIPGVLWPEPQPVASYVWTRDGVEQAKVEGFFRSFTPDGQGLMTYVGSEEKGRWRTLMDNLRSHLEQRNAAFASMIPIDYAGTSHLWSLDGENRASFEGDFVGFAPDGQGLVTKHRGDDGQGLVHLWSLDGEKQASFEGSFASFTPDGKGLVIHGIVDGQGATQMWNLSGEEQASFVGDFRGFIPNKQGLITDSGHETTILWSFDGYPLAEVTGVVSGEPEMFLRDTGFSEDGRFLITAPENVNRVSSYRIWPIDNGLDDLLARGCGLLSSHFRANPSQREELGICLDQPL